MRNDYLKIAILVGAASLGFQAHASTFELNFGGSGVSGTAELTYVLNPNTGVLPDTSPNPVDPIGSYIVTGISGVFSDANIGVDSAITGIVLSNPSNPEPTNLLAPHSFGFYPVVDGVPGPGGLAPGLSYDNLFYPGGSPQTASDYPFHGGVFDIYGIVFTLADGDSVNFWSNGDMGGGLTYGAAVTDGTSVLDYDGAVSVAVPEPASWTIMMLGMGLFGATIRWRTRARSA